MLIDSIWLLPALLGHFGLHLAFYNRINATGLARWKIKAIERPIAVACLLFPLYLLHAVLTDRQVPMWVEVYGIVCLIAILVLGIPWLLSRPIFGRDWLEVERTTQVFDVPKQIGVSPIGSLRCRINAAIPGNQILQLAVESKQLPVAGMPKSLEGLKIAHFSDIHLTGHMLPSFYAFMSKQIMQWQPDLVCLTGDVVDKERCIDWLTDCIGEIDALAGKFFILGNHDTRIADPSLIRQQMRSLGWVDVGQKPTTINLRDTQVVICGNEMPWFGPAPNPHGDTAQQAAFRLLLSHSPDQISWARRHGIELMLAGHTHGGHGRLPWIGPLLSPSHHGSRFASGEFYLPPTTMHVTRGIFGTHLQRINCRPELSLLTLRTQSP